MATKIVLRFNGNTSSAPPQASIGYVGSSHAFGFSESCWRTSGTDAQTKTWIQAILAPRRAGLLPSNVTLTDALMYTAGGGRGVPIPLGFIGPQPRSDQVNVAILASTRHLTAPAQRRWWVHCMPDNWVVDGELVVTGLQTTYIRNYLDAMNESSWLGLVQNDLQSIITISAIGLVSLPGPSPYAVGQIVRVARTLTADKRRRGGNFFITAVGPGLNNFTLGNWTLGATTGGTIFRPTSDFYNISSGDGAFIERAGTKKVGRPFELYRGRQPVRRP
jgi:hypothetical protein